MQTHVVIVSRNQMYQIRHMHIRTNILTSRAAVAANKNKNLWSPDTELVICRAGVELRNENLGEEHLQRSLHVVSVHDVRQRLHNKC